MVIITCVSGICMIEPCSLFQMMDLDEEREALEKRLTPLRVAIFF